MFKKKEKTEKAPKNKKVRTMKVGTHKKSVLLLWAVLLASTSFGVYKNFTAIDILLSRNLNNNYSCRDNHCQYKWYCMHCISCLCCRCFL